MPLVELLLSHDLFIYIYMLLPLGALVYVLLMCLLPPGALVELLLLSHPEILNSGLPVGIDPTPYLWGGVS